MQHYIGNQLVKVLVGQRRSGKSSILRQIMSQLVETGVPSENLLYINKEYVEYSGLEIFQDLEALYQSYREG